MIASRFWSKVDKDGPVPAARPDLGPCWLWTAAQTGGGYGYFRVNGRSVRAHRFAYELLVGPVPVGLELDHLCRVLACINPDHMEPVTHQVNILRGIGEVARNARKTCCPQGHPYDAENTYWSRRGGRHCRACGRVRSREVRAIKKAGIVRAIKERVAP